MLYHISLYWKSTLQHKNITKQSNCSKLWLDKRGVKEKDNKGVLTVWKPPTSDEVKGQSMHYIAYYVMGHGAMTLFIHMGPVVNKKIVTGDAVPPP